MKFPLAANPGQRDTESAGGTTSPEQQGLRVVVGQGRRICLEGHPLRVDLLHVRLSHRGHPHQRLRVGARLCGHLVRNSELLTLLRCKSLSKFNQSQTLDLIMRLYDRVLCTKLV